MSDTLRAIARTSVLSPSPLRRFQTETREARHGKVVLLATGQPAPGGNLVWVGDDTPPERVFALARDFFGEGVGFGVELEADASAALEAELRARGWSLEEEEPALVLTPLPATLPPLPAGLEIRRALTEEDQRSFRTVAEPGVMPPVAALSDPDIYLLIGYIDGAPVATSRAFCYGSVVDITSVVTLPEYRRRGLGTALTWAAIGAAVARGCTAATLTATEMGFPVYIKMGFVPVCTYRGFAPPEE